MYLQHDVRKRWRFYSIHLVTYIRLHSPGYGNHLPLWPFLLVLNTSHDKGMGYDGRESEEICLCLSLLSAASISVWPNGSVKMTGVLPLLWELVAGL